MAAKDEEDVDGRESSGLGNMNGLTGVLDFRPNVELECGEGEQHLTEEIRAEGLQASERIEDVV